MNTAAELLARVETLETTLSSTQEALERAERRKESLRRINRDLQEKLDAEKAMRRSERENLGAWLQRRIAQQEQALAPRFLSHDTRRIMEIEISILRRYWEMIVEQKERVTQVSFLEHPNRPHPL